MLRAFAAAAEVLVTARWNLHGRATGVGDLFNKRPLVSSRTVDVAALINSECHSLTRATPKRTRIIKQFIMKCAGEFSYLLNIFKRFTRTSEAGRRTCMLRNSFHANRDIVARPRRHHYNSRVVYCR